MNPEENQGVEIPGEEWAPETQAEIRAEAGGWKPEHLWEGDPEDWIGAGEFNVRGELMGKIQGMGRKLGKYEQEIADLRHVQKTHAEMTRAMVETTYQKALDDIKAERREAISVGDFEAVDDLDQRQEEIKTKSAELTALEAPAPLEAPVPFDIAKAHPVERAFMDIVATTPELRNDNEKAGELGQYADELWAANPNISTMEFNQKLSERLNGTRRETPPAGPGGRGGNPPPRGPKSRYTKADLSEMELGFAKVFVETEAYPNVQAYIDDAAKSGSLEIQKR